MSKTFLRLIVALFLSLMGAIALAEDSVPGKYLVEVPPGVNLTVTLAMAKNGQFTVGGGYGKFVLSGTLSKSKNGVYQLHAKLRQPGAPNEGTPVDGRWDPRDSELVITRFLDSRTPHYGKLQEPVGDEWVADDPVIENKGSGHGSAGSITATYTQDGRTGTATISISGIPKRIKEGAHIKITLTATASAPANASAWVNLNNCSSKIIARDDTVFTTGNGKPNGSCEFVFQGGPNASIQISGGAGDPGWSLVTFKYHKAKS